jgi:hypothetical protein
LKTKQSLNPNSLKGTYNTPNKRLGKREKERVKGGRGEGKGERRHAAANQANKPKLRKIRGLQVKD